MGSEIADGRAAAYARLEAARVGRLGTVGPTGAVRLVPVCFALDGDRIVSAVDHKPKTTPALARLADIQWTRRATLLVDHYDDDDWSALWWVRLSGPAAVHGSADPESAAAAGLLREKYPQYRQSPPAGPTYSILIETLTWWSASG
ncbi:MAG: TIGR03668 family PPOX class F420-dependent oxidoreductase [Acidimicrobiia bacterium]